MTNNRYRNYYQDNCSHFCTASTVGFLAMLADDRIRRMILNVWDKQRARYCVLIEGFVIMPEHIHILVRGTAEGVRKFMQYSLAEISREVRLAVQLSAKSGDALAREWMETITARANGVAVGKVWKERFRCFPIDQEDAVIEKLQYMHMNPVKRKLIEEPGQWQWSSQSYYDGRECVLRIDPALSCGNS